ncbi:nuclear RNA export factor 1 isoform X2 [Xenopus laevis]|uniref:Nuclear RNA export factor 1 isoform X2 n=1 Tax=Xenopus laevis TaxID=8355 RepID=A0A8J0VEA9_XENLA|nr:nuclear RNA export factor 1 isoform X2 [Xenopus laevis]XP_018120436.1 nuclear RNA export factor 1 isoform X2 [Xenopus laevis]XP_018120437.1 nuclear RNA export factor 1 isoform X2 [Xenopus laevis]
MTMYTSGFRSRQSNLPLSVQLSTDGKRRVKCEYLECERDPYEGGSRMIPSNGHRYRARNDNTRVWFKITIPYGKDYDKDWLLNAIREECGFFFRAEQFHYVKKKAVFFVDKFSTAKALLNASRKIYADQFFKIVINVTPSVYGNYGNRTLCPRDMKTGSLCFTDDHYNIQVCLQKRYDDRTASLDLSNLSVDPDLQSTDQCLCLNKASDAGLILQMIAEHFPEVLSLDLSYNNLSSLIDFAGLSTFSSQLQSMNLSYNQICQAQDINVLHNLELKELWLEGNPFLASLESTSTYYRIIMNHFPSVQILDGHFFKVGCFFGKVPRSLPSVKGSFFVNEDVRAFLVPFMNRYFTIYDSAHRQQLLPLYHENSCCSFSLPNISLPHICVEQAKDYLKENRNLLRVRKAALRQQLMKYNRLQVVGFLCNLPSTEHDLSSFTLDVWFQTPSLIGFSVDGIFKEDTQKWKKLCRSFRRSFLIVPATEACAQILNDQLVIINSYVDLHEDKNGAESPDIDTPSNNLALYDSNMAVLTNFSESTGMKMEWALKCLEDNNWNVEQAQNIFNLLKERGTIPEDAFQVSL